jgi:rod shape-determining protein MreC
MESVLGRYRNLTILVGVLFLQVLGLAVQVKRGSNDAENTRLIRVWAVGAITPFERGLVWAQNGTGNLWRNYVYLRGVRAENRDLKEQIEQMRLEQVRLSEDATQAHRLQALLAFKEQFIAKTVAAQVIGSSGSDLSRVVYIDKGEDAGLKRDMAVITADGIVGKILLVYPSVSQVLLINDQSSGVGVILEKSRLQGVLRGTANGEVAVERVMSDEQVIPGERVLTSGGDQIFPKGLPVGTVTSVGNGKDLFLNIGVKPAADLSKLEEVLVLSDKQERQATAEDTSRERAADILAQRLPSVPDKPPAVTNAVPGKAAAASTSAGARPLAKTNGATEVKPETGTRSAAKPLASAPRTADVRSAEGNPAANSAGTPAGAPTNTASPVTTVRAKPASTASVPQNPPTQPKAMPPNSQGPAPDQPQSDQAHPNHPH